MSGNIDDERRIVMMGYVALAGWLIRLVSMKEDGNEN